MHSSKFHKLEGPFALGVLAEIGGGKLLDSNDYELLIKGIGTLDDAQSGEIAFLGIKKTSYKLLNSSASACIVQSHDPETIPKNIACIIASDPHACYAKIVQKFHPKFTENPKISKNSDISINAEIGKDVKIDSYCVISEGVKIGDYCEISSGVFIGPNVTIGERTIIYSGASIECADVGKNVIIYSGSRIGQCGFGFAPTKGGHIKIPQVGQVNIGDNVEIGANCCIDRGSVGNTEIGEGTYLDNLVHIAHNVRVGRHCAIAGQVGIAGSAKIGDYCMFGGQVGIGGHVIIGNGVHAAGQTGITKNVESGTRLGGTPAVSLTQYHRQAVKLAKISKETINKINK